MKLFLFVVASLLVASSQAAVTRGLGGKFECMKDAQNRVFESQIIAAVHALRDQLKEGIPDRNIPSLDPFVMENWNLQVNEAFAKLDWTMNGVINGLMSWALTHVKFSLAGYKFSYEITVPAIEGKGNYNIDGTILEVLPVYGGGEFDVVADRMIINGSGKIGVNSADKSFYLQNITVGVSLDSFDFRVTGLMEDEQLSHLLSEMISDSLPELLKSFQQQINAFVSARIIAMVNGMLQNPPGEDAITLDSFLSVEDAQKILQCRY